MSTKRTSRHKNKTKPKNTEPEVFVLPPNLLEKLGIKLDKFPPNEDSSTDSNIVVDLAVKTSGNHQENTEKNYYSNTEKPRDSESVSSILETANLMRESVFLSPTFVPTIANVIPGEVEIASVHKECKNSNNQIQEPAITDHSPECLSSVQELIDSVNKADNNESQIQKAGNIKHFPEPMSLVQELIDSAIKADSNENQIQGARNFETFSEPLSLASEPRSEFVIVNSNENQILEPAYIDNFPETLSSAQEILNDVNAENRNENQVQGTGTIKHFLEPLSTAQDIPDETVNIIHNDNCFSQIKENCSEYILETNIPDFIAINFIQDGQDSQESLCKESQNISFKQNKSQENKKNKINIINDEIIDIAKINKLINFDNNKILTPVPVGMLLPPTKTHINRFGLKEVKVPENVSNSQSQSKDKNCIQRDNCEPNEDNYLASHSTAESADVTQGFSKLNSSKDQTNWEGIVYNKNQEKLELSHNILNSEDTADVNTENILTELENDTGGEINSFVNNLNNIRDHISESSLSSGVSNDNQQFFLGNDPNEIKEVKDSKINLIINTIDHNSQYCAMSSEVKIDYQQSNSTDYDIHLQTDSITFQEAHTESSSLFEKKYDDDCNELCNCITKDNICSFKQEIHECNVKTQSMPSSNILLSNRNHTKNYPDNGMRKSKLCIQGVEKPGGQSKPKSSTLKVYFNRKKVNKPIHNKRENTAVMQSLPIYRKNKRIDNLVLEAKNLIAINECEAHENQMNEIVVDTACKNTEYCLCSDFGQLKYYDEDSNFYEHIHFWKHKDTTCKVDVIFSIYADDILHTNEYDYEATIEMLYDTPEESLHKICWTEMYHDMEEIHVLHKDNENIVSEELISSNEKKNNKHVYENQNSIGVEMVNNNVIEKYNKGTKSEDWSNLSVQMQMEDSITEIENANKFRHVTDAVDEDANKVEDISTVRNVNQGKYENKAEDVNIKTGKKRKHSLRVSKEEEEMSLDFINHLSKKDVKCGVCGQILARREWGDHSNKEHGFIAWKAGDAFDFEDKKLILKIKQKLKKDGILKCTSCNQNKNSCKDYISHVKKCVKNEKNWKGKAESSKEEDIEIKNNLTLPVIKKATRTNSLGQKSMNSAKKLKTEISLTSPVNDTSLKCGSNVTKDNNTESALTSSVKEKVVKRGKFSKRVNAVTSLTPPVKEKTGICSDFPIQDQINLKHTSTPLAKEKPGKRKFCSRKIIDTGSTSTTREHDDQAAKEGQCLDNSTEADSSMNISNFKITLTPSNTVVTDSSQEVTTAGILVTSEKKKTRKFGCSPIKVDNDSNTTLTCIAKTLTVKCGVCKNEMDQCQWNDHMQKTHNYIAWKEEEKPLDITDAEQIWQHLHLISKKFKGLICSKCGLNRKYVKAYLSHVEDCNGMEDSTLADSSAKNDIDKSKIVTPLARKRITKSVDSFQGANSETTMTPLSTESADSSIKVNKCRRTSLIPSVLKANVKCGVCNKEMDDSLWNDHIKNEHNYVAWKDGESSIDLQDKDQIWQHLHSISKKCDGLVCFKCGLNRKYVKAYLSHIEQCDGEHNSTEADSSNNVEIDITTTLNPPVMENVEKSDVHEESTKSRVKVGKGSTNLSTFDVNVTVKCGVCKQEMNDNLWNDHIQKEHNYLAWKEEESSLDLQNEEQIWQHLHSISKKCDGLVCSKCGLHLKNVKGYLSHIKQCDGMNDTTEGDSSKNTDNNISTSSSVLPLTKKAPKNRDSSQEVITSKSLTPSFKKSNDCSMNVDNQRETTLISLAEKVSVKCSVCKQDMDDNLWYDHIQKEHNYLAWKEGESSLDLKDNEQVWQHLHLISKKCDGLICSKCGLHRKYVKTYLNHINNCDGMNDSTKADSSKIMDAGISTTSTASVKETKCGDPSQEVKARSARNSLTTLTSSHVKVTVKCGVCKQEMDDSVWCDHIQKEHNYLAWKEGESSLDLQNEEQIWQHLHSISKKCDGLVCSKCGLHRKYVKGYLSHIKQCDGMNDTTEGDSSKNTDNNISTSSSVLPFTKKAPINKDSSQEVITSKSMTSSFKKSNDCSMNVDNQRETTSISLAEKISVKCGVCKQDMGDNLWYDHIQKEHNYLAWKEGESSLDLKDKEQVWQHLHLISKQCDGLICSKCGLHRKYVKPYLNHINNCDGKNDSTKADSSKIMDAGISTTSTPSVTETKCGDPSQEVNARSTRNSLTTLTSSHVKVTVKCGVCKQEMDDSVWCAHIQKEHNYLAWKEGENSFDLEDKDQIWHHLHSISKKYNGLICSKCCLNVKYVRAYFRHIEHCDGTDNSVKADTSMNTDTASTLAPRVKEIKLKSCDSGKNISVKCDVCEQEMDDSLWVDHIQKEHNYLAWKEGETSVDFQDRDQVWQYLHSISKKYNGLVCWKCGLNRKYVKAYWGHIKQCGAMAPLNSSLLSSSMDISCISEVNMSQTENKYSQNIETCNNEKDTVIPSESEVVKCGVCNQDIKGTHWIEHIRCSHNYIAWKHGEQPLELTDTENVKLHLVNLSKQVEAFTCAKCGDTKKYPKVFMHHIETCDANFSIDPSRLKNAELIECGVCAEQMKSNEWKSHAMNKHYNVAWRVGEYPIDLKSPNAVERYLKEYKQAVGTLVCKVCSISRVSAIGFYAHVLICGKSEKEIEEYNNHCEICDKAYVCVYKNQHMAAHREQENAKQRKIRLEEIKAEETVNETPDTPKLETMGRRKAAVKARNDIEKLKINEDDDTNTCVTCGFEAGTAKKLALHTCTAAIFESGSDTDDSYVSGESDLSEESDGSDSVTDNSEEKPTTKKRRFRESCVTVKVPNMPCKYDRLNCYMKQNEEDFFKIHYTDEILFPEWLDCKYEHLEDSQLNDYIPKVDISCKIKLDHKWGTLDRYEVKKYSKGCSLFVGGSIQCLSWIPPAHNEANESDNYLAISCHRDADSPRHNFDELATHTGVIQIWNFCKFGNKLPKPVFCIAHDYGTVWAMDWCPSGAREVNVGGKTSARLGLLAVACSNGFVYIFSVPYPSTIEESDKMFYKLKPVAELRISMSSKRRTYQATAISWSKQKGHAIVMVGYADGTTALYDLCTTSPLLKCIDNGVTVFYPYIDRRDHNVCVTDVDVCPVADVERGGDVGALCSSSVLGSLTQLRSRAAQPRLAARAPSVRAEFAPGWPSVLVLPDDSIAYQSKNELDWYGCGRRVGPASALAGCRRCGRVLAYTRPLLRYIAGLPPYSDLKKHTIAIIKTSPLSKKRKLVNDELAMLVEPLTYDEVITRYGVEVTPIDRKDNVSLSSLREPFTERFPLSEVTAMAFCLSRRHHRVAAVGLHAGFVLILAA